MRTLLAVLAAAVMTLSFSGQAQAEEEGMYHEGGVSFSFEGWERFDPPVANERAIISVQRERRDEPLRVCTLERYADRRAGDNADQGWLNERLIERAESLAQTLRHAGAITSRETLSIDGVAVLDVQASGEVQPQPARSHNRFFFVRHGETTSAYRMDCVVFGHESTADRAAVDALMNSIRFYRD